MKRKCVNCYELEELSPEAKEKAIENVRRDEGDFLAGVAREDAAEVAAWELANRGFDIEDGPWYDLDRGEFAVKASWHGYLPKDYGGGLTELEKEARAAGATVSIALVPYRGDRATAIKVEVEADSRKAQKRLGDKAHALAEEALRAVRAAVGKAWEAVYSDEYITDLAEGNEWLFTKDGEPCPL